MILKSSNVVVGEHCVMTEIKIEHEGKVYGSVIFTPIHQVRMITENGSSVNLSELLPVS